MFDIYPLSFSQAVQGGSDFCDCALAADVAVIFAFCFFFGEP